MLRLSLSDTFSPALLLIFSLQSLALGQDVTQADSFWNNLEVDFFGVKVFGGRDCVVEVIAKKDGMADLLVTKGGSKWSTKCKEVPGLQKGQVYTAKTSTMDIDCTSIDTVSAPYVDLSAHFTPEKSRVVIRGIESKCCCVGGQEQNVCHIVPIEDQSGKFLKLAKKGLYQIWNPFSEALQIGVLAGMAFKKATGCALLVGKGYHSHTRGAGGKGSWLGFAKLPNTKCQAKRSALSLALSDDNAEEATDEGEHEASRKAKALMNKFAEEQPYVWYTKEISYDDKKTFRETAEKWMKGLQIGKEDKERLSVAADVVPDHLVIDSSGIELTSDDNPETIPKERFPLTVKVRYLTQGVEGDKEEL